MINNEGRSTGFSGPAKDSGILHQQIRISLKLASATLERLLTRLPQREPGLPSKEAGSNQLLYNSSQCRTDLNTHVSFLPQLLALLAKHISHSSIRKAPSFTPGKCSESVQSVSDCLTAILLLCSSVTDFLIGHQRMTITFEAISSPAQKPRCRTAPPE